MPLTQMLPPTPPITKPSTPSLSMYQSVFISTPPASIRSVLTSVSCPTATIVSDPFAELEDTRAGKKAGKEVQKRRTRVSLTEDWERMALIQACIDHNKLLKDGHLSQF